MKNESSVELKSEIRKFKQTIHILELSQRDNSNISSIKSVTNDGKDLQDDNDSNSISSTEVLERLQVFYEIEE